MNTSDKIEALLRILGRLADAPPATSAPGYQLEIRRALADLPDVSKAGGADVADDGPVRLKRRENATAGGVTTIGESATRWSFYGLDDWTRTTAGDANLVGPPPRGGARPHLDTPVFTDTIGGDPLNCEALSCWQAMKCMCCTTEYVFYYQAGLTIHDGGLISAPACSSNPGLCLIGNFQWY